MKRAAKQSGEARKTSTDKPRPERPEDANRGADPGYDPYLDAQTEKIKGPTPRKV